MALLTVTALCGWCALWSVSSADVSHLHRVYQSVALAPPVSPAAAASSSPNAQAAPSQPQTSTVANAPPQQQALAGKIDKRTSTHAALLNAVRAPPLLLTSLPLVLLFGLCSAFQ